MAPSDFCNVRLSAAGIKAAGPGGQIRVTVRHMSYVFTAAQSTRVLTSEWSRILSRETSGGEPVLELAPDKIAPVEAPAAEEKLTKGGK